ncbi:MAG: hypothetical protein ABEK17_03825 [Candidatus Aenigmatarchaeota archaeon]
MSLNEAKDALKVKSYRYNIPFFTKNEFDEPMDDNKKQFFNDVLNLHEDRFLISAARDYGKTWLQAMLALWSTTVLSSYYNEPYKVSILGGSREQSRAAYDIIKEHINASDFVKRQVEGDPKKSETNFKDGSNIKALAASTRSVRGQHPHLLCLDEVAEVDREVIISGTESIDEYRTNEDTFPPRLVMTSTPHVFDSFFVDHLQNPEKWGFRTYTWKGVESYNISEQKVKDAKKRLSSQEFKQEYLGEPVSSDAMLLDKKDLQNSIIQSAPEWTPEGYITGGVDWGRDHPTAIAIVQQQGSYNYVMDFKMWRKKKFEWIKDEILKLYDRYEIDMLYCDNSHQPVNERLRDGGAHVKPIPFSKHKQNMISNLLFKFENGRVKIPNKFSNLIEQLGIYHRDRKEKDDAVDALMLALHGQKRSPRTLQDEVDKPPISLGGKR